MTVNVTRAGALQRKALLCGLLGMLAGAATASADLGVEPTVMASAADEISASFDYLWIAGAAFHPIQSATSFSYPGAGCISKTAGSDSLFVHRVVLPAGALVEYLRLYYFDTSTSTVTAFFTTYDAEGNFTDHASVGSVDAAGGYGSVLSPPVNYQVDRATSAINVVANLGTEHTTSLQFCGVRIAYYAPVTDRIFANGFELIQL